MPSSSASSANNSNVSMISEYRGLASRPAPIRRIHTTTPRRTNLLSPSCRIAGSEIPVFRGEAAAIKLHVTTVEPEFQNFSLLFSKCTRPGRVNQNSTSYGICSKSRLLPGSSRLTKNYSGLKSSVSALWTTVTVRAPPSPINMVRARSRRLNLAIYKVSQTSSKLPL